MIALLDQQLKHRTSMISKLEEKLGKNQYWIFIRDGCDDIEELNESEEEDMVDSLPQQKQLDPSMGRYSSLMKDIRDKKHQLNLRRTYEIFKDEPRLSESRQTPLPSPQPAGEVPEENRVTVNSRFKDFLLN